MITENKREYIRRNRKNSREQAKKQYRSAILHMTYPSLSYMSSLPFSTEHSIHFLSQFTTASLTPQLSISSDHLKMLHN